MAAQHRRITTWLSGLVLGALPLAAVATNLSSSVVPKWQDPLPLQPNTSTGAWLMPKSTGGPAGLDYYQIAARPFYQQVLPAKDINGNPLNPTLVFGFGPVGPNITQTNGATPVCDVGHTETNCFHYPAATIVAPSFQSVQVNWLNQIADNNGTGNFRSYPQGAQFDQNFHWANPTGHCVEGGAAGQNTDCTGGGGRYMGPVPMIVHLHGAVGVGAPSDGIPEAWNLPANSPGFVGFGSDYCHVKAGVALNPLDHRTAVGITDCTHTPGAALFQYPNPQGPTTLFFHDHSLGVTLNNIAMGLVGGYLIKAVPGSFYDVPSLPSLDAGYDIPLVIQDKSFTTDGQVLVAEQGNIMVVNGKSWPYLNVQPRKYIFRFIHGGANEYYHLHFSSGVNFTQIAADQGYLPTPQVLSTLTIAPGERQEVVVDFSGLNGRTLTLQTDSIPVLQVRVQTQSVVDTASVPATLPHRVIPAVTAQTVKVSLFDSLLGAGDPSTATPMRWDEPTTESPAAGSVQEWDIYNAASQDSHPMHLHEVAFQVIGRTSISGTGPCAVLCGPRPGETGLKDTVIADRGMITKVVADFTGSQTGLFAWHCHITPHEDEEMMRPMCIVDKNNLPPNPTLDGLPGCPPAP